MDVEKWLNVVEKCQVLKERDMVKLLHHMKTLLTDQPNLLRIKSPVVVCGDIHGQFYNLMEIMKIGRKIGNDKNYLFLGDYIDRGFHSIEVLTYLMLLKVKYPKNVFLLRGNHECRQITFIYGFYDACMKEYGNQRIWKMCCHIFDLLSLSAIIDNNIFAVHGGISSQIPHIEMINSTINRNVEPTGRAMLGLMWSDPDEGIEYFADGGRGNTLYGWKATQKFCHLNKVELICRSHQNVMEGYRFHFESKKVVTLFSAANYCYRIGNLGGIMVIGNGGEKKFITFRENEDQIKTTIERQNSKNQNL